MDTFLTDELKSVPGSSYTSYEFLTGYDSTEETEDHSSAIFMKDGTAQVDSITRNVLFFSAETYNRITGENVTVEPGTALYMSVDGVPMPDTMTLRARRIRFYPRRSPLTCAADIKLTSQSRMSLFCRIMRKKVKSSRPPSTTASRSAN